MRLIQISDCHLLADTEAQLRGVNPYAHLHQLLQHCQREERAAAGFVLTGDLSHAGCEQSYQHLQQLFAHSPVPVYALPGNHDNKRHLYRHWHEHCGHGIELGDWQLLMLDSCVAGEEYGHISTADLNWLQLWLKHSCKQHTLIAVHHPPLALGSAWMDAIGLRNGDELLNLLKDYPQVKALIHGHAHQAYEGRWETIRILGCPSSGVQFLPLAREFALDEAARPGYRWLELNADGSLDTGVVRLDIRAASPGAAS